MNLLEDLLFELCRIHYLIIKGQGSKFWKHGVLYFMIYLYKDLLINYSNCVFRMFARERRVRGFVIQVSELQPNIHSSSPRKRHFSL